MAANGLLTSIETDSSWAWANNTGTTANLREAQKQLNEKLNTFARNYMSMEMTQIRKACHISQ
eukprot:3217442-Alexandrium_andersonii.AAC.1